MSQIVPVKTWEF